MSLDMNKHTFKGHKTLLGSRYVTYGEVTLAHRDEIYTKSTNGFDWGNSSKGAMQLAFSILYQLSDKETAELYAPKYTKEVVKKFNARNWKLSAFDVAQWIRKNKAEDLKKEEPQTEKKELKPEPEIDKTPLIKNANNIEKTKTSKAKPNMVLVTKPKRKKRKNNVVKDVCKELNITQKQLAEILEVPEGTVSSWAVKNEIPRLGKKAIEFYTLSSKNQKIVDSYRDFMHLLHAS
jgi:DNA-binding transcriptional regulator YiaG